MDLIRWMERAKAFIITTTKQVRCPTGETGRKESAMKIYTIEINFKDGGKAIEQYATTNAVSAHHMAYAKYKGKVAATVTIAE